MVQKLFLVLIVFIALQHFGFLILEMFLWQKPMGLKIFGLTAEAAAQSASLAMNQGLYNGFLAAGLIWGLSLQENFRRSALRFFLVCILVAGIFGAATVKFSIFVIQGCPALIALIWLTFLPTRSE
jgi:putative membrane protein